MTAKKASPDVLTAEAAGRLLGFAGPVVLELARKGLIPGKKVGREWSFSRAAIREWKAKNTQENSDRLQAFLDSGEVKISPPKKR